MAESSKSSVVKYSVLSLVILAVIGGAWYLYAEYSKYVQTDDAYVDADNVSISSKMLGRIVHQYAAEGDSVHEGELIVELDSEDLLAQRNNMLAQRAQAAANRAQAEAKLQFDTQSIKTVEISAERATTDYERAKQQLAGDVISKEQFEHIKSTYDAAQSQLNAAKSSLNVSHAQLGSSEASIASAESQIHQIETQLHNTKIYAPATGVIAKRWLMTGEIAQPGQAILSLSSSSQLRVLANLEETKMEGIHLGSRALFNIDAFPGVEFGGRVVYLSSAAASQFALIPPNNAAGDFTKVTQRVPLKISIDTAYSTHPLRDFHFIAGMSAEIKIPKLQ